jgi:peroxiredoxin Q/BCP
MTAKAILRYNPERDGEIPMDVNDKAPDFTLPDENEKPVSLKEFRGKTVVLFFFPKADTPGWTIEARGFRESYKKLQNAGAVVLGISADKPATQKKFQDKYDLPYTLLSDVDKKTCEAFGVIKEKNMYGRKVMGIARTTFVIGPDGKIVHVFEKVKPEGHAEEVLAYLKDGKRASKPK